MATTFNFELNKRPSKKHTYVIMLRITQNRKHKRIKTTIELTSLDDFNPIGKYGKWIRDSEPRHKVWNHALELEIEKARATYRELKEDGLATSELIKTVIIAGERSSSFLEYARRRTNEIYSQGGYNNYKKYNGFCNKLESFLTSSKGQIKDLTFNELNPSLLAKFQTHLAQLANERDSKKRLHPNTIVVNLNIFKTILQRAINIDKLMKLDKNPFSTFTYKGVRTLKQKLDRGEISSLEALSLDKDSLCWNSRNCFLFSFYCAGIRVGDLLQLRWQNITSEGRLQYAMGKNHKPRDLKLIGKAIDLLNLYKKEGLKPTDYIFPYLDPNAEYAEATTQEKKDTVSADLIKKRHDSISAKSALLNKYLKIAAKMAGIEKNISMHVARHTFARFAKDSNIDNGIVQGILAHENSKTTDVYMGHFDTLAYDNAMDTIFGESNESRGLSLIDSMSQEEKRLLLEQLQADLKKSN